MVEKYSDPRCEPVGIPSLRNQKRKPRACVVSWKPSEEVSRNKVNR